MNETVKLRIKKGTTFSEEKLPEKDNQIIVKNNMIKYKSVELYSLGV